MIWRRPSLDRWRAAVRRLDHVVALINPVLVIVAACLLVLDLSCLAALEISRLPRFLEDGAGKREMPTATGATMPGGGTARGH